jgi:hypothetical protein
MLPFLNKERENKDSRFFCFCFEEHLRNSVDRDAMLHEK